MSTRATITFVDKDTELVKLNYHHDGYIEGLGYDIAKWFLKKRIGNGIGFDDYNDDFCNGVGCMVAKFIHDYKTEPGELYVIPLSSENKWYDYNYRVIVNDEGKKCSLDEITKIIVTNWDKNEPIFRGSPGELLQFKEGN